MDGRVPPDAQAQTNAEAQKISANSPPFIPTPLSESRMSDIKDLPKGQEIFLVLARKLRGFLQEDEQDSAYLVDGAALTVASPPAPPMGCAPL